MGSVLVNGIYASKEDTCVYRHDDVAFCGNYDQYDEGIGICSTDGKDVVSMQLWF
jgi:hypothetical protein